MEILISRKVANSVFYYTRHAYPKEFFAFLKGKMEKEKLIVSGIFFHPTLSTEKSVSLILSHQTNLSGIIGTAHSHPNGALNPSKKDLKVFQDFPINIISDSEKMKVFFGKKEIEFKIFDEKIDENESQNERLHTEIFFGAINERKEWKSFFNNSIFLGIVAILLIVLLLTFMVANSI